MYVNGKQMGRRRGHKNKGKEKSFKKGKQKTTNKIWESKHESLLHINYDFLRSSHDKIDERSLVSFLTWRRCQNESKNPLLRLHQFFSDWQPHPVRGQAQGHTCPTGLERRTGVCCLFGWTLVRHRPALLSVYRA